MPITPQAAGNATRSDSKHNCCTTVAQALNAGNPGVPSPQQRVWTPKDVLSYCIAIQKSDVSFDQKATGMKQDKTTNELTVDQMKKARYDGGYKPKYHTEWDWDEIMQTAGGVE